ncbi:TraB/GumN family protein [Tateyamaria sp. SN6-1]|uniref:TraB/GumN family protein n=1 Tax=Tateyamaria sp. SN6-1 TaxID=3092148 RepID=UPI0039F4551A
MRALLKFTTLAALCLLPTITHAACTGQDIRADLTPGQRAEIAASVAAMPYAEGNHWRATRGDQTITLLGTMHLYDPRMQDIVDRLAPRIAQADLLMVEITETEEADLQRAIATDPTIAFLTEGPSLIDRTTPETWAVLAGAAQARGVPPFMAAKYQPWFLSLTLSLPVCALADLRAGRTGLDKMVITTAKDAGVPVTALETHTELLRIFAADTIDEQVRYLPMIAQMQKTAENATASTVAGYFEEKHGELIAFSRVFSRDQVDFPPAEFETLFDEMMAMLLDQRNLAWMDRIDARDEDNIVIAVGAAHLGGATGLVNQLAERGYTVERLPF